MKTASKREYRLGSSPMIHTPGILRWAINGYRFKRDRKALLRVFTEGYQGTEQNPAPSAEVFDKLLKGEIPWEEKDNGVVVFTA